MKNVLIYIYLVHYLDKLRKEVNDKIMEVRQR